MRDFVTYLASVSHLDSFSKGTLDLKDVVYFLSIIVLGLFATGVTGANGIPANAVAITGNLTVTGQTTQGFVSLGPDVAGLGSTSNGM